jgi:hypothetical protein
VGTPSTCRQECSSALIFGPNFIEPFREHHIDPKGIVGHDFVDANGNNSLASLPFMLTLWVFVLLTPGADQSEKKKSSLRTCSPPAGPL